MNVIIDLYIQFMFQDVEKKFENGWICVHIRYDARKCSTKK